MYVIAPHTLKPACEWRNTVLEAFIWKIIYKNLG